MNMIDKKHFDNESVLPPPGLDNSEQNAVYSNAREINIIVPASANLVKGDLLTISWVGVAEETSNNSYPLPITDDLEGKDISFIITRENISKNRGALLRVWYSVHMVGEENYRVSKTIDLNILTEESPLFEDFERFELTEILSGEEFDTERLRVKNTSISTAVSIAATERYNQMMAGKMMLRIDNNKKSEDKIDIEFKQPISELKISVFVEQLIENSVSFMIFDEDESVALSEAQKTKEKLDVFILKPDMDSKKIKKLQINYNEYLNNLEIDYLDMTI